MTKLVKFLTSLALLALLITGLYWLGANTNWFRDDPKTWGQKSLSEAVSISERLDGRIKQFAKEDGFILVGKDKYDDVILSDVKVKFDRVDEQYKEEFNNIDYMFAYAIATESAIPDFIDVLNLNNRYVWADYLTENILSLDSWYFNMKATASSEKSNETADINTKIAFVVSKYWKIGGDER